VNCGLPIRNCSLVTGLWDFDAPSGLLFWQNSETADPGCLQVFPQELSPLTSLEPGQPPSAAFRAPKSTGKLRVGNGERRPAMTQLIQCPALGKLPPPGGRFNFTEDGALMFSGDGAVAAAGCLTSVLLNGVQLWSKPLPGSKVAALLVNVLSVPQSVQLPLADVPGLGGGAGTSRACATRDVWRQEDFVVHSAHLELGLASHASAYYIFDCAGSAADVVQQLVV